MHRWSKLFIPTLREAPADAEVASHKFLLRAGYVRQLSAGIYSYLFMGQRSLNKIVKITREEMDRIGQEFLLPALHPRELWEESGRWTGMGQNMFRLQDRKGAWLVLGMTHEEVMTDIARKELRSYKQLPQIWYQIQTKFRDEPRPKSGLLRVRQFIMKDSYSFDVDAAGLDESYRKHDEVYRRIFTRCGLNFVAVEADSGAMGGSQSQEFMVYSEAGEDLIASCSTCGYAANMEKAAARLAPVEDLAPGVNGSPELVHTPGQRTIEEVGDFLNVEPVHQLKTMAYMAVVPPANAGGADDVRPVVVFLRGDHTLNEAKLAGLLPGVREIRPMQPEEIESVFRAPAGYLGPVGLDILPASPDGAHSFAARQAGSRVMVILDRAVENRANLIAGANQKEYHLRNVTPGRDFSPTMVADVRNVQEGEDCPVCPAAPGSPMKVAKAVEIGHIFKLGYRYSETMGARVLDANGKEIMPIMGCYGIGMERILTSAIEQNHDQNGFWMPSAIAPFDVVVTVTNVSDPTLAATGEQVASLLESAGFDVLLDDRNERAGVKFKDADLVGIPYRVNVGKKAAEGRLELVTRATASSQDVEIAAVATLLGEVARPE
ncbi:MAG TPA: proline--tRNA ligase [Acidobacteriaceae bacterium]|nr:proline--tRNA ligase [Acidobacteriaceae bacterium]